MLHRRTLLRIAIGAAAALVLLVGVANAVILLGGNGSTTDPAKEPHAQVALVLGAGLNRDGRPSAMLEDRLRAGAALYKDGRVDRVLASGDHGRPGYDEVNAMRRELVRLGVPDADVFTDHAGFDTLDSVVRARKVFNVDSAIVVTQGFHLPRALWLARRAGLTVHGLEAGAGHGYGGKGTQASVREVVARTKAFGDILTGAQPKYLGPRVDIDGDARASRG
ncbi:MAG TPA: ElyC/SanA/YdcF family protein [Baekduia sp.]|nr:ElyC/SanA/YdcF family protein [Baekduia sp.]